MFRSVLIAAAIALSAGLVAGCGGGDPEPKFAPSSDPTTPSSTVTSSPKQETAEQFIRRWWAISDKAEQTGRTADFRKISDSGCESCTNFARQIEQIYRGGGTIKFPGTTIVSIRKVGVDTYRVKERSPQTRLRNSSKGPWSSYRGGIGAFQFDLGQRAGGWVVADYSELTGSPS